MSDSEEPKDANRPTTDSSKSTERVETRSEKTESIAEDIADFDPLSDVVSELDDATLYSDSTGAFSVADPNDTGLDSEEPVTDSGSPSQSENELEAATETDAKKNVNKIPGYKEETPEEISDIVDEEQEKQPEIDDTSGTEPLATDEKILVQGIEQKASEDVELKHENKENSDVVFEDTKKEILEASKREPGDDDNSETLPNESENKISEDYVLEPESDDISSTAFTEAQQDLPEDDKLSEQKEISDTEPVDSQEGFHEDNKLDIESENILGTLPVHSEQDVPEDNEPKTESEGISETLPVDSHHDIPEYISDTISKEGEKEIPEDIKESEHGNLSDSMTEKEERELVGGIKIGTEGKDISDTELIGTTQEIPEYIKIKPENDESLGTVDIDTEQEFARFIQREPVSSKNSVDTEEKISDATDDFKSGNISDTRPSEAKDRITEDISEPETDEDPYTTPIEVEREILEDVMREPETDKGSNIVLSDTEQEIPKDIQQESESDETSDTGLQETEEEIPEDTMQEPEYDESFDSEQDILQDGKQQPESDESSEIELPETGRKISEEYKQEPESDESSDIVLSETEQEIPKDTMQEPENDESSDSEQDFLKDDKQQPESEESSEIELPEAKKEISEEFKQDSESDESSDIVLSETEQEISKDILEESESDESSENGLSETEKGISEDIKQELESDESSDIVLSETEQEISEDTKKEPESDDSSITDDVTRDLKSSKNIDPELVETREEISDEMKPKPECDEISFSDEQIETSSTESLPKSEVSADEKRMRSIYARPKYAAPKHPIFSSLFARHISKFAFGPKKPKWYMPLTTTQLYLFKDIVNYIEIGRQGLFRFDDFLEALQDFDPTVTRAEVVEILDSMEKSEFEELDFGKFLFLLACKDQPPDISDSDEIKGALSSPNVTPRQCLILSAISYYVLIASPEEIERYYTDCSRSKVTVLHNYLEATRLQGLTSKQMEEKQKKAARHLSPLFAITGSPYAYPVPLVTSKKSTKPKSAVTLEEESAQAPYVRQKGHKDFFDTTEEDFFRKMHYGRIPLPYLTVPREVLKEMRKKCTVEFKDLITERSFKALEDYRHRLKEASVLYNRKSLEVILSKGFPSQRGKEKFLEIYNRYMPLEISDVKNFSLWVRPAGYMKRIPGKVLDPETFAFGSKV